MWAHNCSGNLIVETLFWNLQNGQTTWNSIHCKIIHHNHVSLNHHRIMSEIGWQTVTLNVTLLEIQEYIWSTSFFLDRHLTLLWCFYCSGNKRDLYSRVLSLFLVQEVKGPEVLIILVLAFVFAFRINVWKCTYLAAGYDPDLLHFYLHFHFWCEGSVK